MPQGRFTLTDRDAGYEKIVRELKRAAGGAAYTKVGVMGTARPRGEGEIGPVELAVILEFGAPKAGIPERSYLRRTFDAKRDEAYAMMKRLASLVYAGKMGLEQMLGLVGVWFSAEVKKSITTGEEIPPPNTPEVFMRKLKKNARGFNATGAAPRTLVDTGRHVDAIAHEVVVGGQGGGERHG